LYEFIKAKSDWEKVNACRFVKSHNTAAIGNNVSSPLKKMRLEK
jgi:hypothetical protein